MRVLVLAVGLTLSLSGPLAASPSQPFKDCAECPLMVKVPAGSFVMGATPEEIEREGMTGTKSVSDELVRHAVSLGAFSIGAHEVTREQFGAFVKETNYPIGGPCWIQDRIKYLVESPNHNWLSPGFEQKGDHPVVCVNWNDATAYAAWLSRKTGKQYRLPSEAEWEYAARGGTTASRFWGDTSVEEACKSANVADTTGAGALSWMIRDDHFRCTDGVVHTAPVGRFRPNPFGLYDVLGNVWEWTEDCYNSSYRGAPTDGSPWRSGNCRQHVTRGASWEDGPAIVRAATRVNDGQTDRANTIGFRVARSE